MTPEGEYDVRSAEVSALVESDHEVIALFDPGISDELCMTPLPELHLDVE